MSVPKIQDVLALIAAAAARIGYGGSPGCARVVAIAGLASLGAIIGMACSGGESDSPAERRERKAQEQQEALEDCFNPWDGNLDALEDLVRPKLNDRGSMQTHETRFSRTPDADGFYRVRMSFSAENSYGGRVTLTALGEVNPDGCRVRLVEIIGL